MTISIIYKSSPSGSEGLNNKQKNQFDNNLAMTKFSNQLAHNLQIDEIVPLSKTSANLADLGNLLQKDVKKDISISTEIQQVSPLQHQSSQPPLLLQTKLHEALSKHPQPDGHKSALIEQKTERLSTKPEYWDSPSDLGSKTY